MDVVRLTSDWTRRRAERRAPRVSRCVSRLTEAGSKKWGFTYGARVSFVDRLGPRSRISFPFTWGGERQARAQLERTFARGPIARLSAEGGIGRHENPHFEIADTRTSLQARAESSVRRWLRLGAGAGIDDVEFGRLRDRIVRTGGDVTLDTRVDPAFPRNAVHAAFGIERLSFDRGGAYLHLTLLGLSLDVARVHETGNIRWHFGMGVTFK